MHFDFHLCTLGLRKHLISVLDHLLLVFVLELSGRHSFQCLQEAIAPLSGQVDQLPLPLIDQVEELLRDLKQLIEAQRGVFDP